MIWDQVVRAIVARLEADAELVQLLGGAHVYRMGARRDVRTPSVEWFIVSAIPTENFERCLIQLDIWAKSYSQATEIERRLQKCLHRDLPEEVEGLWMFLQWVQSRDHGDPKEGLVHRSVDFRFEPVRAR